MDVIDLVHSDHGEAPIDIITPLETTDIVCDPTVHNHPPEYCKYDNTITRVTEPKPRSGKRRKRRYTRRKRYSRRYTGRYKKRRYTRRRRYSRF